MSSTDTNLVLSILEKCVRDPIILNEILKWDIKYSDITTAEYSAIKRSSFRIVMIVSIYSE